MQPKLVELEAKTFVGLETPFISILSPEHNNDVVIPQLWDRYLKIAATIPGRKGPEDWGICEPLDVGVARSHPDELTYMAGAEVMGAPSELPVGLVAKRVPAGRYAVFVHRGSLERLGQTMNAIYGTWLPTSGCELRRGAELEHYTRRFAPGRDDSELDIYLPIQSSPIQS